MAFRFARANPALRSLLIGASLMALAGCQTSQLVESMEIGDATPGAPPAVPRKNKGALPAAASAYTDPLVVSVPGGKKSPAVSRAKEPSSAEPAQQVAAPADLGELTMQPTTVSAGRNSIFSPPPEAAMPELPTGENPATGGDMASLSPNSNASSSIVPADLPSRAVSPMSKSLFSADLPEPVEPMRETAVMPDYQEPMAPAKYDAAEPVSLAEEEAESSPSAKPVEANGQDVATAEAPQKKRRWLPSLSELLSGGKKNKAAAETSTENR